MRGFRPGWLAMLLLATPAVAEDREPGAIFVAANSAYESGDYETAIGLYRELVAGGAADGRVHYNLGNAYLRNGELGRAIAEFRRSRRLLPRDQNVRANLAFARDSTKDALAPPEPSPILSTLFFWHQTLSARELAAVTVVANLLFWGLAILRLVRRRSETLRWFSMLMLILLVASAVSLFVHWTITRPVAVIVPLEVDAHTAPDSESVIRFKLHAGSEVRVKEEREGWLRIALPDGQQGWIEVVGAEVVEG